jgi:hypothetical protein
MKYGVWTRVDTYSPDAIISWVSQLSPDCFLADVEGRMASQNFLSKFDARFGGLPRALIATGAVDDSFDAPAGQSNPSYSAFQWGPNWDMTMQDYITASSGGATGRQCPSAAENFTYWRSTATIGPNGYRLQNVPNGKQFYHIPVLEVNAEGIGNLASQASLVAPWGSAFGVYLAEFFTGGDWTQLATM